MSNRYGCRKRAVAIERGFEYCKVCLDKQIKIDRLEDENKSLKAKLRYRDRKIKGEFFGSSTPSSQRRIKTNTDEEKANKQGGAKPGHKGNCGRHVFNEATADEIIDLDVDINECPACGGELEHKETDARCVVDSLLLEAQKILYQCQVKQCVHCRTEVSERPVVLPKSKYGPGLISNSAMMHFLEGIPLKKIETMWGDQVIPGNLTKIFHKCADQWEPAVEQLKKDFQQADVRHADETGWRTNGHSGYSWLFCSDNLSLFSFRDTRSSKVVEEVLGVDPLPGVLVVDRYAGYNKTPCKIQYCYEHLKRNLDDLLEDNSTIDEVKRFVKTLRPLLVKAMKLRRHRISDKVYYEKAKAIKAKIQSVVNAPADHLGVRSYQDIFIEHDARLFHWVESRAVPTENNKAERELRPTVIARKVSFGSQSEKGAHTRSIMMTVLHTAVKRLKDKPVHHWFKESLEMMIKDPSINPYSLLPDP